MAKKKPLIENPSNASENKISSKEISENLKLRDISDIIYQTKKEGTKEIRKVTFQNPKSGISLVMKAPKINHPLRNWDKRMLNNDEDILLILSVPNINQKKITDFAPAEKAENSSEVVENSDDIDEDIENL